MPEYKDALNKAHKAIAKVITSEHFRKTVKGITWNGGTSVKAADMQRIKEYFETYYQKNELLKDACRFYREAMKVPYLKKPSIEMHRRGIYDFWDFADRLQRNLHAAQLTLTNNSEYDYYVARVPNHKRKYWLPSGKGKKTVECYKNWLVYKAA